MAPTRRDSVAPDDQQLAAMGKKQELKRNFSPLSMLGLAFAILNSWTALSASMGLALPSGGSTSVLWGLVTAGICNLCLASSLAEFLSAYPTVCFFPKRSVFQSLDTDQSNRLAVNTTGWLSSAGNHGYRY